MRNHRKYTYIFSTIMLYAKKAHIRMNPQNPTDRMANRACCREVKIPNQYGGVIL